LTYKSYCFIIKEKGGDGMPNYMGIRSARGNKIFKYETTLERTLFEKEYGKRNCKAFALGHEAELFKWTGINVISETESQRKIRKDKELEIRKKELNSMQEMPTIPNTELVFLQLIEKYKENNVSLLEVTMINDLIYLVPINTIYEWNMDKEIRNVGVSCETEKNGFPTYTTNYYVGTPGFGFEFNDIKEKLKKLQTSIKKECEKHNETYNEDIFKDTLKRMVMENDKTKIIIAHEAKDIEYVGNFLYIPLTYTEDEGELIDDEHNLCLNINQIVSIRPSEAKFNSVIDYEPLLEAIQNYLR
jgi:hypothetical protein